MSFLYELLHAFGAGIAFAVGISVGVILTELSHRKGREELAKGLRESNDKMHKRVGEQVVALEAMTAALSRVANINERRFDK